jgi:hypothetical protein
MVSKNQDIERRLTRTEILMTVKGDDVLLMVNKNRYIDDG